MTKKFCKQNKKQIDTKVNTVQLFNKDTGMALGISVQHL